MAPVYQQPSELLLARVLAQRDIDEDMSVAIEPPTPQLRPSSSSPRLMGTVALQPAATEDVAKGFKGVDALRMLKAEDARSKRLAQAMLKSNAAMQSEMHETRVEVQALRRAHSKLTYQLRQETLKRIRDRRLAELKWSLLFLSAKHYTAAQELQARHQEEKHELLASVAQDLAARDASIRSLEFAKKGLSKELEITRAERSDLQKNLAKANADLQQTKVASIVTAQTRIMQTKQKSSQVLTLQQHVKEQMERVDELEREKAKLDRSKLAAIERINESEMEQLKIRHEAAMHKAAATCLQKVTRGKLTRTERALHKTQSDLKLTKNIAEMATRAADTALDLERKMAKSNMRAAVSEPMKIMCKDGRERPAAEALIIIMKRIVADKIGFNERTAGKFWWEQEKGTLMTGMPEAAALGLAHLLRVDEFDLFDKLGYGIKAIEDEFKNHGTEDDLECLHYVLHEAAGTSTRQFANGIRDQGRSGETFQDFVNHEYSQRAKLRAPHVLALRMYTTAAYRSLNNPLRDQNRTVAHPFAATVFFLTDGIRRLRAIGADDEQEGMKKQEEKFKAGGSRLDPALLGKDGFTASKDLWRGLRNMSASADFEIHGGSEMAPMSTTPDPAIAIAYGQSSNALLFKITATSFMNRGADISYLSAFPEERELLYTPLTYLRPTGRKETIEIPIGAIYDDSPPRTFTILEVEPQM